MNKKFSLTLLLALFLLFILPGTVLAAPNVVLNGNFMAFDTPPAIENGRILVPLRAIFEPLGVAVSWDASSQTVTAVKGNQTIQLKIGSKTASNNSQSVNLDVPAKIINGRTMVPLRFVSEALGCDVKWTEETQTVVITDSNTTVYSDPQGRFKIFYPKYWKNHEDASLDSGLMDLIVFSDPDENISDDFVSNICVVVFDRDGKDMDMIKKESLENIQGEFDDLKVISEKDITIAGRPGFERQVTYKMDGLTIMVTDIYVYNDDYIYEIAYGTLADETQTLKNKLRTVVNSIQIFESDNLGVM